MVPKIVAAEGFAINPDKTRIMRPGRRQSVTGVIVNREMGLSRQDRRKLRAAMHREKMALEPADPRRRLQLQGKLAYLFMLNAGQAAKLGWRSPRQK